MQKGFGIIPIVIVSALIIALGAGGYFFYQNYSKDQINKNIFDFESCAKAGNPVTAAYPGTCRTSDGRLFVQPLSDEEKKKLVPPSPNISDETANWKIVKDRNNIFSFRLPKDWEYGTDIFTKANTKSLRVWITESDNFGFMINYEKETLINGKEAIVFEVEAAPLGRSLQVYLLKDQNTVVRLSAYPFGRNNPDLPPFDEEIKNKFQQIISTIQFLK